MRLKLILRLILICASIVITACGGKPQSLGGDELRNGGGGLSQFFQNGRDIAVQVLTKVRTLEPSDFPTVSEQSRRFILEFYAANRDELATDVLGTDSNYPWVAHNENGACGATRTERKAKIQLAYDKCSAQIFSDTDAGFQLIGESSHHLGVDDDSLAALLIVTVRNAYRRILNLEPDGIARKILFDEGRHHAAGILRRLAPSDYQAITGISPEDRQWLRDYAERVATAITTAPHNWIDELPGGKCVALDTKVPGTLKLSHVSCRGLTSRRQSGRLLVAAELGSRFPEDPARAARLTGVLYDAWAASGHPDEPHVKMLPLPTEMPFALEFASVLFTGKHVVTWGGTGDDRHLIEILAYDPMRQVWMRDVTRDHPWKYFAKPTDYALTRQHPGYVAGKLTLFTECHAENRKTGVGHYLDYATKRWISIDPPTGFASRYHIKTASGGDFFVLLGGRACADHGRLSDGFIYNGRTGEWLKAGALPQLSEYDDFAMTLSGSSLYVWGGCSLEKGRCTNEGAVLDLTSGHWSALPVTGAPTPREQALLHVVEGQLVVYGGIDNDRDRPRSGAVLDLARRRWRPMSQEGAPRRVPTLSVTAGPGVLFFAEKVTSYHPGRDEWTTLTRGPAPLAREVFWTGGEAILWGGTFNAAFYP